MWPPEEQHLLPEKINLEFFASVLKMRIPDFAGEISEPYWLTKFTVRQRIADTYKKGRIFLAGDAAHTHSPLGGQGMNTGFHDVFNLAWKLAHVFQGKSANGDELLASYDTERREIGKQLLSKTGQTAMQSLGSPWLSTVMSLMSSITSALPALQLPAALNLSMITVNYHSSPLSLYVPPSAWSRPVEAAAAATGLTLRGGDRGPDGPLLIHKVTPCKVADLYSFFREHLLHYVNLIFPPSHFSGEILETCKELARFTQKFSVVSVVVAKTPEAAEKYVGISTKNCFVGVSAELHVKYGEGHIVLLRPDSYIAFLGDFATSVPKFKTHVLSLLKETL